MTPSANEASAALDTAAVVPAKYLQEGEVVIFAIKPSPWFVLLSAWPVLTLAAIVGLGAYLAVARWTGGGGQMLLVICLCAAGVRLLVAGYQWAARLYILTNLRVMRVRGLFQVDVFECPLRKLTGVVQTASAAERTLGIGNIMFGVEVPPDKPVPTETCWLYVSRPAEVLKLVREAMGQQGR